MTVPIRDQLLSAVDGRRGIDAADRLCETCVALFDVDAAAISLVFDGATNGTLGCSDEQARAYDEVQFTVGEGPCLESVALGAPVLVTDLADRTERRWPMYSAAAAALGVRSALSFKLYTSSQTAGALNLFALEPGAFDAEAETIGAVLAAHAAAAIIASRQSEQLESALSTRDRIGQAKGIIMERYNIDDVAAFDMLRRLSQDGNTKLTEIAEQVIQTRGT